ncbi:EI24 domain-containing protein [Timonella sp. A28]|uniref:EI24 domain-containing protein n=1 Tax=Timonella sp. A28 TaxID=3442640 RepID=UPI003EB82949
MFNAQKITAGVNKTTASYRDGLQVFFQGLRWLLARPKLYFLGMLPAFLVALILFALFVALLFFVGDLVQLVSPFAEEWHPALRWVTRFLMGVAMLAAALVLSALLFVSLATTVGDPVYQRIWEEVERDIHGSVPAHEAGFFEGVKDGLWLMLRTLLLAAGSFAIGLIPVVGPILASSLMFVIGVWILTNEATERTLTAHGLSAREQRALLRKHNHMAIGFGVASQFLLAGIFLAVLVMPVHVVGSALLAHRLLESDENYASRNGDPTTAKS